ncbi:MYB-CC type transcription factor, LHEQLE-containing domain, partial [Dillenia turbinata]
ATPKTIMKTMGVKGLTLYHLKSHLQKYRLGKQASKELAENSKDGTYLLFKHCLTQFILPSCAAESQDTGSSSSSSTRMIAQDLNEYDILFFHLSDTNGYQVTEALRVQMEVQRRLHEQLEVQRRLQLRIETQSKYLQSILEKACKALNDQGMATNGLEAAREELSDLAIMVSNDCNGMAPQDTFKMPSLSEISAALDNRTASSVPAHLEGCSVESCLTSTGSPISPMTMASQVSAVKKRSKQSFANGGSLPLESNMRHGVEWTMANVG